MSWLKEKHGKDHCKIWADVKGVFLNACDPRYAKLLQDILFNNVSLNALFSILVKLLKSPKELNFVQPKNACSFNVRNDDVNEIVSKLTQFKNNWYGIVLTFFIYENTDKSITPSLYGSNNVFAISVPWYISARFCVIPTLSPHKFAIASFATGSSIVIYASKLSLIT